MNLWTMTFGSRQTNRVIVLAPTKKGSGSKLVLFVFIGSLRLNMPTAPTAGRVMFMDEKTPLPSKGVLLRKKEELSYINS